MHLTDPIADMLTRVRNANMASHEKVDVPFSKEKLAIVKILKDEGRAAANFNDFIVQAIREKIDRDTR